MQLSLSIMSEDPRLATQQTFKIISAGIERPDQHALAAHADLGLQRATISGNKGLIKCPFQVHSRIDMYLVQTTCITP